MIVDLKTKKQVDYKVIKSLYEYYCKRGYEDDEIKEKI